MAKNEDAGWISDAIVDFLRSPLYIHPLMAFIDEKCMIFTPEEENKLEYTVIHEEFKGVVDKLLTDFLEELGVNAEKFFEIVSAAKDDDQLTAFVVQTILTVDDFVLFKAMMVKRNSDLTYQVLNMAGNSANAATSTGPEDQLGELSREEKETMEKVMALSAALLKEQEAVHEGAPQLRVYQLENEDDALVVAIAASLSDIAAIESDLAELNQAIALSLALEAEMRRVQEALAAGEISAPPRPASAKPKAVPAPAAPAPKPAAPAPKPAAAAPPAPKPAAAAAPPAPAQKPAAAKPAAPPAAKEVSAKAPTTTAASAMLRGDELADVKSEDLAAMRAAAHKVAETQQTKLAEMQSELPESSTQWLREQKKKLIAMKQVDRQKEMDDFKKDMAKPVGKGGLLPAAEKKPDPAAEREAKREALRQRLASKFKQDIMSGNS